MKRFLWIVGISILAIIIGFIIGTIFLPANEKQNDIAKDTGNNVVIEKINSVKKEEIQTSTAEEKVSVNTKMTEITYYNDCNHQVENTIKNTEKYVNMTKNQLQKEFPNWEIKQFNKDEVILYKEEEDFCNEHFLVKDEDGYVSIYTIDNNGNILELLDKTDIATIYLAKPDQENLTKGMIIYKKENLNKLIEDFE